MKFENPYSKNRFNKIERFDRRMTAVLKPLLNKYMKNKNFRDMDIKQKPFYIPNSFHNVAYFMKGEEEYTNKKLSDKENYFIETNSKPNDVELKINCIFISECIIIENLDEFKKGIKKAIENLMNKSFLFSSYDSEHVDDFCTYVEENLNGGRWSNFGYIKVSEEHELYNIAETLQVYATHLSSSFIILGINVTPSEKFLTKFNEVVEKNYEEDDVIKIRLKTFFSHWQHMKYSNTSKKSRIVEDMKLELKWIILKYFNKHFNLFLTSQNINAPSLETYLITLDKCTIKSSYGEGNFFRALKFNNHWERDISNDGFWEIYHYADSDSVDSSLKVTCNTRLKHHDMFQGLESEVTYRVNEYAKLILPIMIMNVYLKHLSQRLALERKKSLIFLNKNRIKYKKVIKLRVGLEQDIQILKRIKNEFDEKQFNWFKGRIKNEIGEYEKPYSKNEETNTDMIIGATKNLISDVDKYSSDFRKILNDRIELQEIKVNNSLRNGSTSRF